MTGFVVTVPIRFQHCDPAGIVFYPRYYEMLNAVVEDWFEAGLGLSFRQMHLDDGVGVPAVSIETRFLRPSRLGDRVDFTLTVRELGRSSIHLDQVATCAGQVRMTAALRLAYTTIDPDGAICSAPIPDDLRSRMQAFEAVPQVPMA